MQTEILQIAIDESEGQNLPENVGIFMLGGYASTPSRWETYKVEWQDALDLYGIKSFSLKDINESWEGEDFVNMVNHFQSIISRNVEFGLRVNCHPKMIKHYMRRIGEKRRAKAHYYCAEYLIQQTLLHCADRIGGRNVEFVFDRGRTSENLLQEMWIHLRQSAPNNISQQMEILPRTAKSSEDLRLQAADMTVWFQRRHVQAQLDEKTAKRFRLPDNLTVPYDAWDIPEEWVISHAARLKPNVIEIYAGPEGHGFLSPNGMFSGVVSSRSSATDDV